MRKQVKSWRAFLSSPEGRNAVVHVALRLLSTVLPAIAVQRVIFVVTNFGSNPGWFDGVVFVVAMIATLYTTHRIGRWHDQQDKLEDQRSRQEN